MTTSATNGIGSEEQLTGRTGPSAPPPASPPASVKNGSNGSNGASAELLAPAPPRPWSREESAKLYGIQSWGQGYFSINDDGHVVVHPTQDPSVAVDLKKLVDELRERDIGLPDVPNSASFAHPGGRAPNDQRHRDQA